MTSEPMSHSEPGTLSNPDIAVLSAMRLQKALDAGEGFAYDRVLQFPRHLLRPVRPRIGSDETMLTSGMCRIQMWDAPGDGSYASAGMPIMATGLANQTGVSFAAGAALGTAAVNAFRRNRAKQDVQARWMDLVPQGALTVSTHGVYVEEHGSAASWWDWDSFDAVEMVGQSCARITVCTEDWTGQLLLHSDWAELIFVTWVEVCFPQHPSKYGWVPPGWRERVLETTGSDPFEEPALTHEA